MAHSVPAEADPFERRRDVVLAPRRPGVDDGRLAAAREDVCRYEPEVDPFPRHPFAGCGGRTGGRVCRTRPTGYRRRGAGRRRVIGELACAGPRSDPAGAHPAIPTTARATVPRPSSARKSRRERATCAVITDRWYETPPQRRFQTGRLRPTAPTAASAASRMPIPSADTSARSATSRRSRVRAREAIDETRGPDRGPQRAGGLDPVRLVPEPAAAREHREAPALGFHEAGERRPVVRRRRPAASQRSANVAPVSSPSTRSTDASRAAHGSGAPAGAQQLLRRRVDAAGQPVEGAPQRALSRSHRDAVAARAQRAMPWWQLHDVRRAAGRAAGRAPGPRDRAGQRRGRERHVRRCRSGRPAAPGMVAVRLVMAVQLAVRRDHDERRRLAGERLLEAAAAAGRARTIGIDRRHRLERHGRRQQPVVEHRDDRAAVAEIDPDRTPRVEHLPVAPSTCHGARIVWLMPSSASTRSVARSTAVSGSHMPVGRRPKRTSKSRRPQRTSVRRSAADASGRIVWWKGWAMPFAPRSPSTNPR